MDEQNIEQTNEQAEAVEVAEVKPRRKKVKGVVATARRLLREGQDDKAILAAIQAMYLEAGRDEKNAKATSYVILHDAKNRKPKRENAV